MSEDCLLRLSFARSDLPLVRARVAESLFRAGVSEPVRGTFVQAALEIACNAVVHGGGSGHLALGVVDGELRCEVTDQGPGLPADVSSQQPSTWNSPGLRLAEALTGGLRLRNGPGGRGTAATLVVRLEPVSN
ncbi:anti-sigma regulatory factor (Ser/Thr protein kinase) [Kibdelosporangium banguiense]|uniref:Anti-sigma regulatory factor (Ser/Thr protein kinase) n=1 Tax=Kibdelosporangium banguiense TaxID=1365924 RepID=A0ABS4TYE9_9PSEU|nr:ATP-binding protein [Kibdelosporangium banguiense]MBP2329415.1 anti-sigma regulatory factor (Ser/Thr protein kinase) [Kibdelosporangium banguiense]